MVRRPLFAVPPRCRRSLPRAIMRREGIMRREAIMRREGIDRRVVTIAQRLPVSIKRKDGADGVERDEGHRPTML